MKAFQYYIEAGDQNAAHRIVVDEIAPDLINRGDDDLLERCLAALTPSEIVGWHDRGNVSHSNSFSGPC